MILNKFGVLEDKNGDTMEISVGEDGAEVIQVSSNEIECNYTAHVGDFLQLNYNEAQHLQSIDPHLRESEFVDEISIILDGYGIVGNETYFTTNEADQLTVGDTLMCDRVRGEYTVANDNSNISYRCISYKKIESDNKPSLVEWKSSKGYLANNKKPFPDPFPMAKLQDDPYEDIPSHLRDLMFNEKTPTNIHGRLDEIMPPELNILTYRKIFHHLLYLEELHLMKQFHDLSKEDVAFHPKSQDQTNAENQISSYVFTLEFEGLHELRPSILKGDTVHATHTKTQDVFIGCVHRTNLDSMDVKFEKNFAKQFKEELTFNVEFFYARGIYKKMHTGVERAVTRLGETFLFPKDIGNDGSLQLDVQIVDGALKLNEAEVPWFKKDIDDSQKAAVVQALRAKFRPLPNIIHGPPGTGKTSTLIEIILHIFTQVKDSRILVAAHSNSAANLILSRLLEYNFVANDTVRLLSMAYQEKKNIPNELNPYCATFRLKKNGSGNEKETEMEAKVKIFHELVCVAPFRIVIGTCVGLGPMMSDRKGDVPDYTHVIVDEAGQCSEPEIMIPISMVDSKNGSVVLAGDPMQMPPLVLCNYAKSRGLAKSLLERLVERHTLQNTNGSEFDHHLVSKLLYNYRSMPSILNFYNKNFYDNELIATVSESDSPEANILSQIQETMPKSERNKKEKRNEKHAIFFQNILGKNQQVKDSNSWFNSEENRAIMQFIPALLELKFASEDIGVITPYHLQVTTLRKLFAHEKYPIMVGSVDEFQGLEKKIILISTVRTDSNRMKMDIRRKLGIVACPKRTNVAISRARALVVVFGKADLLKRDLYWGTLIKDCEENGTFCDAV